MTQSYRQILDVISATRRAWLAMRGIEGGAFVIAALVGGFTLATAVDQLVALGGAGRWVIALLVWAGVGVTAWRLLVVELIKPHSDDALAVLLEQRGPATDNRLINALQLGRDAQRDTIASAYLPGVEALVTSAGERAGEVRVLAAVQSPRLKWAAAALAVALLFASGLTAFAGAGAGVSFSRVLSPWANLEPFTRTQVRITSPTETWHGLAGATVTVQGETFGLRVDAATLEIRDDAGRRRSLGVLPDRNGKIHATFDAPLAGADVWLVAGDGVSETLRLDVDTPPRITSVAATIRWPAYTGRGDERIDQVAGQLQMLSGSTLNLDVQANKPLRTAKLIMQPGGQPLTMNIDATSATCQLAVDAARVFRIVIEDEQGYSYESPAVYTVAMLEDRAPSVAVTQPGRDLRIRPGDAVTIEAAATDDFGLGMARVVAVGQKAGESDRELLVFEPARSGTSQRYRATLSQDMMQLEAGQTLRYRVVVSDRREPQANVAASPVYAISAMTAAEIDALMAKQLTGYVQLLEQLIELQRQNLTQTRSGAAVEMLLKRQSLIREQTLGVARMMRQGAFVGETIIERLEQLGQGDMAEVVALFEKAARSPSSNASPPVVQAAAPMQEKIIAELEAILERLSRNEHVRRLLKKMKRDEPKQAEQVQATATKLSHDLDKFLTSMRALDELYEKMNKRNQGRDVTGEDLAVLEDVQHRLDRWKQWAKDSVDQIQKLPDGFVKDSALADSVEMIFEEIEKKAKSATVEMATPIEEGVKALATEVAEDLEMWMPDTADHQKWVMEDALEGRFEVPETPLPENLQDIVGDLIEDAEEFDEEADDITGGWGGNMQMGWTIADGPISSYSATGKTGNQLPNNSEMGGRSGAGRRGRSSGQMVGSEGNTMEGRPTPARVTNEPYEASNVKATKQLDPRGATGGGRKTGTGQRGLQGGTPPDYVKQLDRLANQQTTLRERTEKIARQLNYAGRPSDRVDRAAALFEQAQADLHDQRYEDAARKRKMAIGELQATATGIDETIAISLQRAADVPPDMRDQVLSTSGQAMPAGYEQAVGAYYKAISEGQSPGE